MKKNENGTFYLDENKLASVYVNVGGRIISWSQKMAEIKAYEEAKKRGTKY